MGALILHIYMHYYRYIRFAFLLPLTAFLSRHYCLIRNSPFWPLLHVRVCAIDRKRAERFHRAARREVDLVQPVAARQPVFRDLQAAAVQWLLRWRRLPAPWRASMRT